MSIHVIRIIRELTDTANLRKKSNSLYCVRSATARWEPNTDIFENEQYVIIRLELAGVDKERVGIKLSNGRIVVCGHRRNNLPGIQNRYHQLELQYGSFSKTITIPESLIHNDITAKFENGILDIEITKESNAVEIPITVQEEK
jgi:HSP20 family protein